MEDNIQRLLAPSLCLNAPNASESIVLKRFQQGEGVNSREISLPPPPSAVSTGVGIREVLMGVGDGVASVIMLTFTKRPGPHADFYKEARPPC